MINLKEFLQRKTEAAQSFVSPEDNKRYLQWLKEKNSDRIEEQLLAVAEHGENQLEITGEDYYCLWRFLFHEGLDYTYDKETNTFKIRW